MKNPREFALIRVKILLSIIGLLFLFVLVRAAQQIINIGTTPNDNTGDTVRVAFQKINSNFTDLYVTTVTNGGAGAGNGIVKSGTNLHFASTSAYTPGRVPYASATNTIGFDSGFSFSGSALTVPALTVSDPGTVSMSADGGAATFEWDGTGLLTLKGAYVRLTNGTMQFAGSSGFQFLTGAGANRVGVSDASGFFSWSTQVVASVLGSGTADSTTFLRGDQTWATVTAGVSGSGTANTLPKWTGTNTLGDSTISDDGAGNVYIGDTNNTAFLFLPDELQLGFGSGGSGQLIHPADGGGDLTIQSGFSPDGFGSGDLIIETREDASSGTGGLSLKTGDSGGSDSGTVLIQTGTSTSSSGTIQFITGDSDNDAGDVEFIAGTSTNSAGGDITFTGGDGDTGGTINFNGGAGSGSQGGGVYFTVGSGTPFGLINFSVSSGTVKLERAAANDVTFSLNQFTSLRLSGNTNRYTDSGTQLLRNGVPVGGGTSETTAINNFYSTNNFFQSGKGNSLVITQTLTVSGQYVYPLVPGTGITFTTNNIGTGQTNITIATTSTGGGVSTDVTALAYSGTNITGFNCTTNNMSYTLTLTNHCLFGTSTFVDLPNTTTNKFFTLGLKQNSAGTWVPKFTNTVVIWAEGIQPVIDTNANAVSYLYFHTHLFTNGILVGSANLNVK